MSDSDQCRDERSGPTGRNAGADFPVGASVDLKAFSQDPHPTFERMRRSEPVSWIPALDIYYVTRHADVAAVLMDDETFLVGEENMLVYDTFGRHMMTVDGVEQRRYRAGFRRTFTPREIRERLEEKVTVLVHGLIDGFAGARAVELRETFASRLPVQVMLAVFGLPPEDEPLLRRWYDAFERSLSNYHWDPAIREQGRRYVGQFKAHLQGRLAARSALPGDSLLAALTQDRSETRLEDEEILQNALIIFFGGISTVEALILNAFHALSRHEAVFGRLRADLSILPRVIEETARWASPVQAVTRYVARDIELHGVRISRGQLVNCMLGSANRDPEVFANPDRFDIDRDDLGRHIAFATGPHVCLGSHLARSEARIAITALLERLPGLRVEDVAEPEGYEFRQPTHLNLAWD
ncbi:MAG: cytochrome P450 [Caulobacter sp.]|nr:cytochrome P450 [Caulobacter sp.]